MSPQTDSRTPEPQNVGLLDWMHAASATGRPAHGAMLVTVPQGRGRRSRRGSRAGTAITSTSASSRSRKRTGQRQWMAIASVAGAVVAVIAAATVNGREPQKPAAAPLVPITASPSTSSPAPKPAVVSDDPGVCAPSTEPSVVRGNGPGGTTTGPEVILAFEHAYYVARDAVAARALVTENAEVSPLDRIRFGIDTIPVGTKHCVTIRPKSEGAWLVEIAEVRPGGKQVKYNPQAITTVQDGDRTKISAIVAE